MAAPAEPTDNFTDSALIGHLLSFTLITKLAGLGIISRDNAAEIFDDALLLLEEHQARFPENETAFETARDFLSKSLDGLPASSQIPPWRNS